MIERRLNNRHNDELAVSARSALWGQKQAESDRDSTIQAAKDKAITSDWLAKVSAARNKNCEGFRNFRGV